MLNNDHCIYTKRSKDKFIIMLLYVNKGWLSSNVEMKDMGETTYILEVKIPRVFKVSLS